METHWADLRRDETKLEPRDWHRAVLQDREKCMEEMESVFGGTPGVSAFHRERNGVVVEHDASVIGVDRLLDLFRGLPSFYQDHVVPSLMANPGGRTNGCVG